MAHFLDLREKTAPKIVVVKEFIIKRRPWWQEVIKVAFVIAVVISAVWGISKADTTIENILNPAPEILKQEPIGIYGTVGTTTDNTLILTDAQGQEVTGHDTFTVDLSKVEKIQNNNYEALSFADIWIGDKMIAHGILDGTLLHADSLIVFMSRAPKATTTATTTEDVATTTPDVATSTEPVASTTPEVGTDSTDSTSPLQAGSPQATTTPPVIPPSDDTASSTNATTTEPVATSTEQVTPPPSDTGTSTNPTPPMQPEETASTTPAS